MSYPPPSPSASTSTTTTTAAAPISTRLRAASSASQSSRTPRPALRTLRSTSPTTTLTPALPPPAPEESDEEHSEHGEVELAPLPSIPRARTRGRASFTSGVGVSAADAGATPGVLRSRPRAFSAGAGAGNVPTVGGHIPEYVKRKSAVEEEDERDESERMPTFSALTKTASRMSQRSNMTFVDAGALVGMHELGRIETRAEKRARARAGTITTLASLARRPTNLSSIGDYKEKLEDDGMEEELVAVQITESGEEIVYPDGGTEAYLVLLGGVCAAFCAFGLGASLGAFQSYYQQHLLKGYDSSTISWIGSTQAAVCFSMCVFTGPLFDRYGCKPLLASGTFLLVLGFCMLSLCKEYYQIFLCHATLIAFGMDLMFIVPMGAVGQFFMLKRGLAFGILMMGSSAGAIIWPVIIANLPQKVGFGWTMRVIALLMGVLGTVATLLIRTRLPPRPPGPFFNFREFKTNPGYLMVAMSFPFFVFGLFSFLTFIGTYGTLAGLGTLAPYLLMIMNGSSGFGRVFAGLVADKIGTYNVAISGLLIMAILNFSWLAMKTSGPLIALCVLYGFSSGAPVSLQGPMVTSSASDPRQAGTLIGQALLVQSMAQLTGPPIFGAIIGSGAPTEQLERFPHAIIFGSLSLLIAAGLVTGARLYKSRDLFAIV